MLSVIIRKELKRVFTDRRLLFSSFFLPAISIFIMYSMIGRMAAGFESDILAHQSRVLAIEAPASFLDYLKASGEGEKLVLEAGPMTLEEGQEALKLGELDLILAFDADFDEAIAGHEDRPLPPEVRTWYNPSEEYSAQARSAIVVGVLGGYQDTLLLERFGASAKAFAIDRTNPEPAVVDEARAIAGGLSMILPLLLAILLFAGAMGIGIDTIAGEKERGTMAALLVTPVPRRTLAMGKTISLGIIALLSAIVTFGAIAASLPSLGGAVMNGGSGLGAFSFSPLQYFQLVMIMVSLAAIYVGLVCLISVKARSIKEAGTLMSPVYMAVMAAGLTTLFGKGDAPAVSFAIPVYSSIISMKKLLLYELEMSQFLMSTAASWAAAGVLVLLIARAFDNEKTMFNT